MRAPLCVYCQSADGGTRDHVPPRGLFPKPWPSTLVTVPCCETCRKNQSRDDEYFIRTLALHYDLGESSSVQALLPKVTRSLAYPKQRAFNQSLFRSIKEYQLAIPAGTPPRKVRTYSVDLERLKRVVTRVTVGLFSHEFGRALPTDCYRSATPLYGTENAPRDTQKHIDKLLALVLRAPERSVQREVHFYHVLPSNDDPCQSLWLHVFFTRAPFLAVTSRVSPGSERSVG